MNKNELMENYTAEQLAGMVINLQSASEVKNDEIHKLKWQISSLEEGNGRLQAEVDTYNKYLLPRCTKEARRMIDENRFAEVRIVTWDEWNNRGKAEGEKVLLPKEYENCIREILNIDTSEIKDDCCRFNIESLQRYLKMDLPKKQDKEMGKISVIVKCITKTYSIEEIGDIVRAYEDIKYCKEHDGEHLHSEEYLKIISLNRDVARLESARKRKQEEIESLKKQLDRSQTTITCLERLSAGLKADFNTATEKIKDLANENMRLQRERNDYKSKAETLETERMQVKLNEFSDFLPTEPIKIADMLIDNATVVYENYVEDFAKAYSGQLVIGNPCEDVRRQTLSYLRQIAEHLLVYCGHSEGDGE